MSIPLYEKIYQHILHEVKEGRLRPGDRVPSERELAEQFQVSRITSKNALDRLEAAGVLLRRKGKGTFVARPEDRGTDGPSHGPDEGSGVRTCGLILPDFSETYGLYLLYAIEERCSELGIRLLLKRTYGHQDQEERAIRHFAQSGVDGLIVFPVHGEHYNTELLRLVFDQFPLVLVDRYLKGIPACCVYTDNRTACKVLTQHLIELGHEQIAFVSPPSEHTSTIEDRLLGYMQAFHEKGIGLNAQHILSGLRSPLPNTSFKEAQVSEDKESLRRWIADHPELTAFVASEYNVGLILTEVLREMGCEAPAKPAVVCFDSARQLFGKPSFTHIRQDEPAMGRLAVDLLTEQWSGKEVPLHNLVDFQLTEGLSTSILTKTS